MCVCVYVYVYMCACMRVCMHACVHACVHVLNASMCCYSNITTTFFGSDAHISCIAICHTLTVASEEPTSTISIIQSIAHDS